MHASLGLVSTQGSIVFTQTVYRPRLVESQTWAFDT